MKLFDDVIIKKTGQRGTIVDEGIARGRHYFVVELDNIKEIEYETDDPWAGLPNCWDDELEPVKR